MGEKLLREFSSEQKFAVFTTVLLIAYIFAGKKSYKYVENWKEPKIVTECTDVGM